MALDVLMMQLLLHFSWQLTKPAKISLHLIAQITRESDVRLYTGIRDTKTFQFLFDQLCVDTEANDILEG